MVVRCWFLTFVSLVSAKPHYSLVGSELVAEGCVEVVQDGVAAGVCWDGFNDHAAGVVCRSVGMGNVGRASPCQETKNVTIRLGDGGCTGNERSLDECAQGRQQDCGSWLARVRCDHHYRLVGATHSGRVHVTHNGVDGVICDDNFDNNAASVLCRQLRLGEHGVSYTTRGWEGAPVQLDQVTCRGDEATIDDCDHNPWGLHDCNSLVESVAVRCYDDVSPTYELVDGLDGFSGRVHVTFMGETGTICDDSFDDMAAGVLCQELGLGLTGDAYVATGGPSKVWLDDVLCVGTEHRLEDCDHLPWGEHNCNSLLESVGVRCRSDFASYRLVGADLPSFGRVEITYQGEARGVCSNSFDNNAATVLCGQLGLGSVGEAYTALTPASNAWLGDVACVGTEKHIEDCDHSLWGDCDCTESAGVRCFDADPQPEFALEEGVLVVTYKGQTGIVCSDGFGDNEASAFCRMNSFGRSGTARERQIQSVGHIWLSEVACGEGATSLLECSHATWGDHTNCPSADKAVEITCHGEVVSFRLEDDQLSWGRVVVFHNGQEGTICDDGFGTTEANLLCKQLGLGEHGQPYVEEGSRGLDILLADVTCSGREVSLQQCQHDWGRGDCGVSEGVHVDCTGAAGPTISGDTEGLVLVRLGGRIGGVCRDGFGPTEASVLCRQLGVSNIGEVIPIPEGTQLTEQIWLDDVSCDGNEDSLFDCRHNGLGSHNCDPATESVAVRCATNLNYNVDQDGLVVVTHEGQTGTVCAEYFASNEANVLCRSFGFDRGTSFRREYSGPRGVVLYRVVCRGDENSLRECSGHQWSNSGCDPTTDSAHVRCIVDRASLVEGEEGVVGVVVLVFVAVVVFGVGVFVFRRRRHPPLATWDGLAG